MGPLSARWNAETDRRSLPSPGVALTTTTATIGPSAPAPRLSPSQYLLANYCAFSPNGNLLAADYQVYSDFSCLCDSHLPLALISSCTLGGNGGGHLLAAMNVTGRGPLPA
ncbi:hypothetical protein SKAU_G00192380 [Synaphobranchus kaupii]|uniref:Uncharacterized protein n=1 Tax=Synaphobranchus kaupii TaxID=118154 RepID=A0A9Q1FDW7_SYNKA|nr:hypothetical protein SKAU_G00192380 [Synaphobranchus kaupii]